MQTERLQTYLVYAISDGIDYVRVVLQRQYLVLELNFSPSQLLEFGIANTCKSSHLRLRQPESSAVFVRIRKPLHMRMKGCIMCLALLIR
jgi:hypothetical protein